MRIYISGQIKDAQNVQRIQKRLVEAGHTVTHDWTVNETGDKLLATAADKLRDVKETARRAKDDLQGVIDCDAFVICTDNETPGKGMYVELDAALALNATKGSPSVFVLGGMNHMSVFYFHPAVIRVGSVEEIISQLATGR